MPHERRRDGWHRGRCADAAPARAIASACGDTPVPDPGLARQDGGVHGWSVVVDPRRYRWRDADWRGRPWHETVLYECMPG